MTTTMDNMTSQSTEDLTSLPSTPTSPGNDMSDSSGGTVAGIIVVCVFLVVSTIIGLIFYLRRRKREVEPSINKVLDKRTSNRTSEISTTWTEIDVPSDRSSGLAVNDIEVESRDVEMQPANMFPLTPVEFSLYDDPELEDQGFNKTIETPNKDRTKLYTIQNSSNSYKRTEQIDENTELGDKNVKGNLDKDLTTPEKMNTSKSPDLKKVLTKDDIRSENGRRNESDKGADFKDPAKRVGEHSNTVSFNDNDAYDYEFVEENQSEIKHSKSSNLELNEEGENIDSEYDIYVNVTLDKRGIHTLENADLKNDNEESTIQTSVTENKGPSKAPIPQPRLSLKNSQSTLSSTDLNTQYMEECNEKKQTDAPRADTSQTRPENFGYNSQDDDLGDYDTVDQIYDVPRNNTSIHTQSEKL